MLSSKCSGAIAISNVSPVTAAAIQALTVAATISVDIANTIVPTALNDALAAITAEILQIQADGGEVPPELRALAQELEQIKAASLPSLIATV